MSSPFPRPTLGEVGPDPSLEKENGGSVLVAKKDFWVPAALHVRDERVDGAMHVVDVAVGVSDDRANDP